MRFRYHASGRWYKGNTHVHSIASDGGKALTDLGPLYAGAGYDFCFATDHRVASRVQQDVPDAPLLWLDGIELDGRDSQGAYYHVVCLGQLRDIGQETPFMDALRSAREQGALTVLAHPFWSGNTLEDALRWGFDGVEIYNHVCRWLNGKSDGLVYWHAMLRQHPDTLGFASDDAHLVPEHPGWNGGWIVAHAEDLSEGSLLEAIRSGNYYASCGPEFHEIALDGGHVAVTSSPVQFIRLVGPGHLGARLGSFDGREITEAAFRIPPEWAYAYLEVEDRQGRRAWTNTLYATG